MSDSDDEVRFGLRRAPASGMRAHASEALELSRMDMADARAAAAGRPTTSTTRQRQPRGIVFLASIPANMRPAEVRTVFERFGEIFRHKFVPKKDTVQGKKGAVKSLRTDIGKGGGNVQFSHGWLEYLDVKAAKNAAESMNATPVQVRHFRKAYGEHWQCKFLGEDFQWGDLATEQEGQRRTRQHALYIARQKERKIADDFRAACAALAAKGEMKAVDLKPQRRARVDDDGEMAQHRNLWQESVDAANAKAQAQPAAEKLAANPSAGAAPKRKARRTE